MTKHRTTNPVEDLASDGMGQSSLQRNKISVDNKYVTILYNLENYPPKPPSPLGAQDVVE